MLGLFGVAGPRVSAWAERVTCPVFFIRQLDDEVHGADSSQALFDRLASRDKYLHSSPGRHEAVSPAVHEAALEFLASRLRAVA